MPETTRSQRSEARSSCYFRKCARYARRARLPCARTLFPPRIRATMHCEAMQKQGTNRISGARMGRLVGVEQTLGIDRRIDLRGRQRGVAEKFLNRAQVAAARQKMRREGMPQCMRCRGVGEAEHAAQALHGELDDARR